MSRSLRCCSNASFAVSQPVGHARRREEAVPLIASKLKGHIENHFDQARQEKLLHLLTDHEALSKMDVHEFIELWAKN